ncbi:MAG: hypothetical protein GXY49_00600 [Syntrophomonadaceae bacterium]|nr:hypothetical protein [Syntrophomonadaceae bacterium]
MQLEEVCHEIVGLVPVYEQNGDCCRIYRQVGEDKSLTKFTQPRTVEMTKRQLARCYALDLTAQGILLRREYQRSSPLPFYLYDGRVFIPLKMRMPKVAGDPSYGYLEMSVISRVIPAGNNHCSLILQDGTSLPVYNQINTARLSIYFGIEIKRDIIARRYGQQQEALQALQILHGYLQSQRK